jgi:hypothetical protein
MEMRLPVITARDIPFVIMKLWLLIYLILGVTGRICGQQDPEVGFVSIFNGKNLEGWKGDPVYWTVENGILTGEVTPATLLKKNSFIIWQGGLPADFELKVDYRISSKGNSGINYRSAPVDGEPYALKGYQADIDGEDQWSRQNYEERGRTFLARRCRQGRVYPGSQITVTGDLGKPEYLQQFIRKEDWNDYLLIIKGNHLRHYINGKLMSEVTDNDKAKRTSEGYLGVQVHVGPPMKIEYRNMRLKKLNP